MALVAELKRRKVFQVGAAYLVVGWLLVQAASIALPAFQAPEWALRTSIFLIALGFPLALVLAWVLDLTPDGVRVDEFGVGTKRLFTLAALLAALAVGWFVRGGASDPGTDYEAPLGPQSTAVLPFMNLSAAKDDEYFSDGLTETLLHKLAQVPDLKVAARTSSFAFKGRNQDIRSIGRQLGVATVMEGSVQRADGTLRITVQLIRSADGTHLWSQNYDRKLSDLFAIQDEIAGAATKALVGSLVPQAKAAIAAGGTHDLTAYELHTRSLAQLAIGTVGSVTEAEALARQALTRDPDFTDARTGLIHVLWDQYRFGLITAAEFAKRAEPELAWLEGRGHQPALVAAFRGAQARARGEANEARTLFTRALALSPNNPLIHTLNASDLRRANGPEQEILAEREAALRLDPLNADYHAYRSMSLIRLQRFDDAAVGANRAIELKPQRPLGHLVLGDIGRARGDLGLFVKSNIRIWRLDPGDFEAASSIATDLAVLGHAEEARSWNALSEAEKPGNLYARYAEVMIRFSEGDPRGVVGQALAIVGRHAEERRDNWEEAIGAGCLAARNTGLTAQLREALVGSRMLPDSLDERGLQRMFGTDPIGIRAHKLQHLDRLAPCFLAPGAAGRKQRQDLREALSRSQGPDWETQVGMEQLARFLDDDLTGLVAFFRESDAPPSTAPRAVVLHPVFEEYARYAGIAGDPFFVARLAESERAIAAQRESLATRLREEGLSLLPPDPASRVTSPKSQ